MIVTNSVNGLWTCILYTSSDNVSPEYHVAMVTVLVVYFTKPLIYHPQSARYVSRNVNSAVQRERKH